MLLMQSLPVIALMVTSYGKSIEQLKRIILF